MSHVHNFVFFPSFLSPFLFRALPWEGHRKTLNLPLICAFSQGSEWKMNDFTESNAREQECLKEFTVGEVKVNGST